MMSSWATRTWLITGGSSGIGRSLAALILDAGGRVAVTARDAAQIDLDLSGRGVAVSLDYTKPETIADAASAAIEGVGPIDVLVNNAGYGLLGAIEETSNQERRAQFEANFFGPTELTTLLLPELRNRSRSVIVNVSSVSAIIGPAGSGYYAASKSAFESWSDALRAELSPFGVHVMIVEPGGFRTNFFGRSRQFAKNHLGIYPYVDQRRLSEADHESKAPGDPRRGAAAIIDALDAEHPPQRLPLGSQAADILEATLRSRIEEIDTWRGVAMSADFSG